MGAEAEVSLLQSGFALAGGGSFTTMNLDDHVATNLSVIAAFLPIQSHIEEADRGLRVVHLK